MAPSLIESVPRCFVTRFFGNFISHGSVILVEDEGSTFMFGRGTERCSLKTILRIHNPQFYWKVMTRADIGLADAFIDGDFSFEDDEGLLDLISVLIANRDANRYYSNMIKKRDWRKILAISAGIATMKFAFQHVLRHNSLTQARRNISRHYDLTENEDLKTAQLRKVSALIAKARIAKEHEVLDIGCGWGTFAIQAVKQTGCKYTGITLSKEQLKYAEAKVKDAGLQDHIKLLLRDYRELDKTCKYNRIISCEMIEHVGHKYMEEFFQCCESLLAEDGPVCIAAMLDDRYKEHVKSSDFMREYIFPGGNLPSLSTITSAMAAASKLSVEHLENIGSHYYTTLRHWRKNFLNNQSKLLEMGYDEKFIRTWEYYFDYCAAGSKSYTLANYHS